MKLADDETSDLESSVPMDKAVISTNTPQTSSVTTVARLAERIRNAQTKSLVVTAKRVSMASMSLESVSAYHQIESFRINKYPADNIGSRR